MTIIPFRSKEKNDRLAKAMKELDNFLSALPPERQQAALEFQEVIRDTLAKAGSQHNRLVILGEMMRTHLLKLAEALNTASQMAGKPDEEHDSTPRPRPPLRPV